MDEWDECDWLILSTDGKFSHIDVKYSVDEIEMYVTDWITDWGVSFVEIL